MKYPKITRSWSVKAENEMEAVQRIESSPDEYLESESVTRTEYKKPRQETGWGASIRNQILGGNSKR